MTRKSRFSPSRLLAAGPLALLLTLLLAPPMTAAAEPAGSPAAAADVLPVSEFSLEQYRGSYVYLDFWASWCTPCKASFPWMSQLQARYRDRGLTVVAVNVDSDSQAAMRFLDRHQPGFRVVLDAKGSLAERFKLLAMPSSYLIGPDGQVLWQHRGFREKDKAELEQRIEQQLQARPAQANSEAAASHSGVALTTR